MKQNPADVVNSIEDHSKEINKMKQINLVNLYYRLIVNEYNMDSVEFEEQLKKKIMKLEQT